MSTHLEVSSPVASGRAWYSLCTLVLLYCMSWVDRQILSLLAPSVSKYLGISDTQIGVLFGLGFAVVYALTGLPLAHLIDRRRRVPLVAAGVILWSGCTVASGFAPNFIWLLILRSGVAVGEAVLSPAAISLIADFFPREKRTLPTTIYNGTGTAMFTGAFITGAAALQLATTMAGRYGLEPWQLTLILVGLPGLLLAPLLLSTVPEPPRRNDVKSEQFATVAEAVAYFRKERVLYGCLFAGIVAIALINAARAAWIPTLLIRGHRMDPARVGYIYGMAGLAFGLLGVAVWPAIVKIWTDRGRKDSLVTVFAAAMTAGWVSFAVVGLARSSVVLIAAVAIGDFFQAAVAVLAPLLIQLVTPGRMRARAMALYIMAIGFGSALGPALVAFLSDRFFTGPFAIGSGLSMVVVAMGPIASIAIWSIHKPYPRALDRAEARETSAWNPAGSTD